MSIFKDCLAFENLQTKKLFLMNSSMDIINKKYNELKQ